MERLTAVRRGEGKRGDGEDRRDEREVALLFINCNGGLRRETMALTLRFAKRLGREEAGNGEFVRVWGESRDLGSVLGRVVEATRRMGSRLPSQPSECCGGKLSCKYFRFDLPVASAAQ